MILGFKTYWNGKPTHFPEKIMACTVPVYREGYRPKLHTIRAGERWKAGIEMHMATGVRTKNYKRFNAGAVGLRYCLGVQKIEIIRADDLPLKKVPEDRINRYSLYVEKLQETFYVPFIVKVDGRMIHNIIVNDMAKNDGFETFNEMIEWFNVESFTGQIIHWTTLRY